MCQEKEALVLVKQMANLVKTLYDMRHVDPRGTGCIDLMEQEVAE